MVIFGASGDLTKRLLVPSLYNLTCDALLSPNFAVLGTGRSEISNDAFRQSMASEDNGLRAFHTRMNSTKLHARNCFRDFISSPPILTLRGLASSEKR